MNGEDRVDRESSSVVSCPSDGPSGIFRMPIADRREFPVRGSSDDERKGREKSVTTEYMLGANDASRVGRSESGARSRDKSRGCGRVSFILRRRLRRNAIAAEMVVIDNRTTAMEIPALAGALRGWLGTGVFESDAAAGVVGVGDIGEPEEPESTPSPKAAALVRTLIAAICGSSWKENSAR